MGHATRVDFARLVGFASISEHLTGELKFRDETVGAKLGAKVGGEPGSPRSKIDFTKLLGFDTVSDQLAEGLDFQNEIVSDKLGARIGPIEPTAPVESTKAPA